MWKNTVEPDRRQMTIWSMCTACWKSKATNTHCEHVILRGFLLQQWLHEHAAVLRNMYIACYEHSEHVIVLTFLLQQWLHERASLGHYMYTACLVPSLPHHTGDRSAYYCFMYDADNRGILIDIFISQHFNVSFLFRSILLNLSINTVKVLNTLRDWFWTAVTLNEVEFGLMSPHIQLRSWVFDVWVSNYSGWPNRNYRYYEIKKFGVIYWICYYLTQQFKFYWV
jgi:hypothetical protein